MVEDILETAAEESQTEFRLESVDLHQMAEKLKPAIQEKAVSKGLSFQLEIPDNLPPVRADNHRLEQILSHLLDNAVKFTNRGEVVCSAEGHENEIIVSVRDTGIGIAGSCQERIFDRFVKLDLSGVRPGAGVGLYLVKSWVERMGGRIRVESEEGNGAIFYFSLPKWE